MNRLFPRFAITCVVAMALSACATQPRRPAGPADEAAARMHDQQRAAITGWQLSGRLAVSSGSQGGSGRIEWSQDGDRYVISLSAPVTRQSWRLTGDPTGARLEGVEGGPLEGDDSERMLLAATGWRIPVRAMVAWVRGIAASEDMAAPARVVHGADNLPASLEQLGWRIDYRDWHPAATDRPALPRRMDVVDAARGDARVRLIVDQWQVTQAQAVQPGIGIEMLDAAGELAAALARLDLEDPAADLRRQVAGGDLRPLVVCGFACLAPGDPEGVLPEGEVRILDGSGDVVLGDRHLRLKHKAEAYARAYNQALVAWHTEAEGAPVARPGRVD
ncbi:outer membrane lipoprotein LolB [Luteimonas aestuarii]|uniref:Outer-membrane lipoprotein LolB n=1 Tax=Luteimonas aestuarii TaxID=453837 RepID=A0A4R5TJH7_9GAMM|nr:lipoprotein insertase outer membrane protein LolB [Luteimonas aestuarii]TDK21769.1 outer membrane lipoprotein LolB [Luteimonas aestuarii]